MPMARPPAPSRSTFSKEAFPGDISSYLRPRPGLGALALGALAGLGAVLPHVLSKFGRLYPLTGSIASADDVTTNPGLEQTGTAGRPFPGVADSGEMEPSAHLSG